MIFCLEKLILVVNRFSLHLMKLEETYPSVRPNHCTAWMNYFYSLLYIQNSFCQYWNVWLIIKLVVSYLKASGAELMCESYSDCYFCQMLQINWVRENLMYLFSLKYLVPIFSLLSGLDFSFPLSLLDIGDSCTFHSISSYILLHLLASYLYFLSFSLHDICFRSMPAMDPSQPLCCNNNLMSLIQCPTHFQEQRYMLSNVPLNIFVSTADTFFFFFNFSVNLPIHRDITLPVQWFISFAVI